MAQWYYAEAPGRNAGPLSSQEIADRFRQGLLMLDSLVWREGMAQWQPLRSVAGELGLDAAAGPPPLPGGMPPLPPSPPLRAAPAAALAPRGMSRGMLILIICAAAALPLLAILAILAAIAVPAYKDYMLRTQVMQPIAIGRALQPDIEAHLAEHGGQCPDNDSAGFKPAGDYASQYVSQITIGEFDDGTCGLDVQVTGTGDDDVDDHAIWLWYDRDTQRWHCSSEIEDRLLPAQCRG